MFHFSSTTQLPPTDRNPLTMTEGPFSTNLKPDVVSDLTEEKRETLEIREHSWSGYPVHVGRSDGSIRRGVVGNLVVMREGFVVVRVRFRDSQGHKKMKLLSPVALIAWQILWMNRDIVSDVDDTDDEETNPGDTEREFTGDIQDQTVVGRALPSLLVHEQERARCSLDMVSAITFIAKQVELLRLVV